MYMSNEWLFKKCHSFCSQGNGDSEKLYHLWRGAQPIREVITLKRSLPPSFLQWFWAWINDGCWISVLTVRGLMPCSFTLPRGRLATPLTASDEVRVHLWLYCGAETCILHKREVLFSNYSLVLIAFHCIISLGCMLSRDVHFKLPLLQSKMDPWNTFADQCCDNTGIRAA